jgi:hypothetical protein
MELRRLWPCAGFLRHGLPTRVGLPVATNIRGPSRPLTPEDVGADAALHGSPRRTIGAADFLADQQHPVVLVP